MAEDPTPPTEISLTPNLPEMTEAELRELAQQLAKPEGEHGQQVAETMNESNHGMTMATLRSLNVIDNDNILEIGFGNGDHVPEILEAARGLQYAGLDISETMLHEATARNAQLIDSGTATFHLGDGTTIDLPSNSFQRVFTVNTIYFWDDRPSYLQQIEHVMAPGATLAIAYVRSDFMKTLPFTQWGFTFTDDADIEELAQQTSLSLLGIDHLTHDVYDKTGTPQSRPFSIARLAKAS